MLEENAVVASVSGEFAEVITHPKTACGSCHASNACGTSILSRLFPDRSKQFRVRNSAGAAIGDQVVIGLNESALQVVSILVYLLPLAGLIGGGILGSYIAQQHELFTSEPTSIITSLLGIFFAFYLVRYFSDRINKSGSYEAKILYIRNPSIVFKGNSKEPIDRLEQP